MIRYTLITTLILLTLFGCSNHSGNTKIENNLNKETTELNFDDFLNEIPAKEFPLTINCGFQTTIYKQEFKEKYNKYIQDGLEVVGKLKSNKDLKLVLYASIGDILYPYLFSYDNKGEKIDSVYLHINTCAADPYLELSTWSIIEKDIKISMTDTAKFYTYIENDKDFSRTLDSTIVTKRNVELDGEGKFIMTNETKERI